MKLAICGKGGSGKSTVVALLAYALQGKGHKTLVVDCDESNSGLYRILGFNEPPISLVELIGGKKKVKDRLEPKYTPDGSSQETNVLEQEQILIKDIPPQHILEKDGISLVSTGKIIHSLEGCACPIGILGREFLRKLCLEDKQSVLLDMEAGIEHFGRGVESSADGVLIIVDPSFESINLAERIKQLSHGLGIKYVRAALNKLGSETVSAKLAGELTDRGLIIIGGIPDDPEVFEAGLFGRPIGNCKASGEINKILDSLLIEIK